MIKVDQTAYHRAMRQQGKVKPDFFPVGNREARRLAAKEARTEARASAGTITSPDAAARSGGPLAGQGDGNGSSDR
jgi:hypothetical protein